MIEKDIIKDQKETIHRLQEECKEKTEIIQELNKTIQDCNIQRTKLYKALKQTVNMCVDKMEEFNSASVFAQEILDVLDISEVKDEDV